MYWGWIISWNDCEGADVVDNISDYIFVANMSLDYDATLHNMFHSRDHEHNEEDCNMRQY